MTVDKLSITQNRTFKSRITIMSDGSYYLLEEGDKIAFGVKKHTTDSSYAIYKEIDMSSLGADNHSYVLTLSQTDTNIAPGDYYFDVALVKANNKIYKVIGITPLEIIKSVVRSGN